MNGKIKIHLTKAPVILTLLLYAVLHGLSTGSVCVYTFMFQQILFRFVDYFLLGIAFAENMKFFQHILSWLICWFVSSLLCFEVVIVGILDLDLNYIGNISVALCRWL